MAARFLKIGNTGITFGSIVQAIDLSQGGGPTADIVATRTIGPAPLPVLFDAQGTTLGDVGTYAFHDLEYTFSFDDAGSGSWGISGLSKNSQVGGPIASHVFETPGTYTVQVSAQDSLNRSSVDSVTITVQDPDVVFAGAATVVVATDGNFTGAPAGSTQVTSLGAVGTFSGKRILLKRGQSFGALAVPHATNNAQFGAWGSGAKPQVSSISIGNGIAPTTDFPSEIVFFDLDIANNVSLTASGDRVLFLRCDMISESASSNTMITIGDGIEWWAFSEPDRILAPSDFYWPREIFVVECVVTGNTGADGTPLGCIYGSVSRLAIMGCDLGTADQHTVRLYKANRSFIGHNRIRGISTDGIRHSIKLHSGGFNAYADSLGSGTTWASSQIIIANNIGGDAADNNDWTFAIRPQNTSSESGEGIEDVIVENCDFRRGFKTNTDVLVVGRRISVRGNTLSGGGSPAISTDSGTTYTNLPPEWRSPYFID